MINMAYINKLPAFTANVGNEQMIFPLVIFKKNTTIEEIQIIVEKIIKTKIITNKLKVN